MKLRYRVHTQVIVPIEVEVTLEGGARIAAKVPALEVELVPEGHHGGSLVIRPIGKDEAERLALFEAYRPGVLVEAVFTPVAE